jgi:hypothetical protein
LSNSLEVMNFNGLHDGSVALRLAFYRMMARKMSERSKLFLAPRPSHIEINDAMTAPTIAEFVPDWAKRCYVHSDRTSSLGLTDANTGRLCNWPNTLIAKHECAGLK